MTQVFSIPKPQRRACSALVVAIAALLLAVPSVARAATDRDSVYAVYGAFPWSELIDMEQYDAAPNGALSLSAANSELADNDGEPWLKQLTFSPDGKSAYLTHDNSYSISQYDVAANGSLHLKSPGIVRAPDWVWVVNVHPRGTTAYVQLGSGAWVRYDIGSDGGLVESSARPLALAAGAYRIAFSPDGRFAYTANQDNHTVAQYLVESDGDLRMQYPNTVPAGSYPNTIAVSPDGKAVYVGHWMGAGIYQYSVAADGRLTPMSPARVAGPGINDMAISADGQSLYVPTDSSIAQYNIGEDHALAPKAQPSVSAGPEMKDIVLSHDGEHAYALGGAFREGRIYQFDVGAYGQLHPMADPDFASTSTGAPLQLAIAPRQSFAPDEPPAAPTITAGPASPSDHQGQAVEFEFAGAAPSGSFECAVNRPAAARPCTSPASYSNLAEGHHTFYVRQLNEDGVAGPWATHEWEERFAPTEREAGPEPEQREVVAQPFPLVPPVGDVAGSEQKSCTPTVLNVSPRVAMRGERVAIEGAGFAESDSGNRVSFQTTTGRSVSATVERWTDTTIVAFVPKAVPSGRTGVELRCAGSAATGALVIGRSVNIPPVVRAVALPTPRRGVYKLDASESFDVDGKVVGYTWRRDGKTFSSKVMPRVRLVPGRTYVFKLLVRDSDGATERTTVRVKAPRLSAGKQPVRRTFSGDALFRFGWCRLTPAGTARVLAMRPFLDGAKGVRLEGHADNVGSADYNDALSRCRANTVRRVLLKGSRLPAARVMVKGYGERNPRATNATPHGRAENRRVELTITY